jgi:hypothetical protein
MEEVMIPNMMQVLTKPSEILNVSYRLLKVARKEILAIFHIANALVRQEKAGAIDLLKVLTMVVNRRHSTKHDP